ncbi:bifunctional 5,10-methylenetetrahydrofolate dehydrogenase/5,10-methenyltetrahydrofolate cyclohydrolase [Fodinicola acaciae]|uniref:bifunctional 5,10-methylenetetrahydrofolate dehydrogenase/5,10-methenyltetrahydrofolate cyclohydrolase n=1 Tax=Fodinicola acaciae TaxID=2681555 RepID=UPI0013D1D0F7|nr:bifunctional 5,10-methylenetetrahydrofolate dehydrogenase/5,10-methenyltetrahydrofolate cyclohydrolase [Fodinicola acaciae]
MISLSGKELAAELRARTADRAATRKVRLAIVTVTDDPSSAWYVRSLSMAATKVGIQCEIVRDLSALSTLDADGVILQTPVPGDRPAAEVAAAIDPERDVDGANPVSLGRLACGLPAFPPATAEAVVRLLDHHGVEIAGRQAVVVGRSTVVGKPLAHLLLDRDATVTVAHSRTKDLAAVTLAADILVVAAGRPGLLRPEHVRPDTIVIDVGTNTTDDGGLVGDVHPAVAGRVAGLSPVPGGVGPVTTAVLLHHTAFGL